MYRRYIGLSDCDLDSPAWRQSIGEILADADISTMSDGEFDAKYLMNYAYKAELDHCCRAAVEELAGQPYEGRTSCARVMGRAMELLRELYGLNVPGGWVPVLRKLRAKDNALRAGSRSTSHQAEERR